MNNKSILVTGGNRSGKSTFAENLFKKEESVLYIATAIITDEEMKERIQLHKERRSARWKTYEGYKDLDKVITEYNERHILLDCVTVMTTNLMFDKIKDFDSMKREEKDELFEYVKNEFKKLIITAKNLDKTLIMVTNEVGWGLISEYKIGRVFSDIAGLINQYIATQCDDVYLVACGLPLKLK